MGGIIAAGVGYVVLATIFASVWIPGGEEESLYRFSLWTNIFFLWPAVRAVSVKAVGTGLVFFLTFAVSVIHHGCVQSGEIREALAAETYWLLVIGTVVMVGVGWGMVMKGKETGMVVVVSIMTIAVVVGVIAGFAAAMGAVKQDRLGGCLVETGDEARAVKVWGQLDFVTAFMALVIVFAYLLQVPPRITLAAFWLFAVIVMGMILLIGEGIATQRTLYAIVGGVGGVLVVGWCAVCQCGYEEAKRRELVARYDWIDVVAGLLLGAVAITVFIDHNTLAVHGAWHVLGAAALYLVVEGLHRKYVLGIIPHRIV